MSTKPEGKAEKGSQRWLQELVNQHPDLIDPQLAGRLGLAHADSIRWLSPLEDDGYTEYRDMAAFTRLGADISKYPLRRFWPQRGPVWDALAKTDGGEMLLFEAKAHIGELVSGPSKASKGSRDRITKRLRQTRKYLGAKSIFKWNGPFYQYANRLAHLYWLRVLNDQKAWLVFVHFLNSEEMGGPETRVEWEAALQVLHAALGIRRDHRLAKWVIDVYVDTRELK